MGRKTLRQAKRWRSQLPTTVSKKKASQRKIWPEVDRSTNQVQPDFWNQLVEEMERKKKEFEHLRGRAEKIKNVFTIDYSIGKTHRKLQLDAEPSWKSMQKFQNEPWNERIKGIKKGPGIKMKTAQFYSKTSFLARWRVAWHSCMWTMTSM
jgi:hypothetical protein